MGALTGGLYLGYWVWEAMRTDRSRSPGSAGPFAAALGTMIVPVQAALLYDIHRQSRVRRGFATRFWSCATPAVLAVAIAVLVVLLPWRSLWTPGWLLAPLPFLLVQSSINREARPASAMRRSSRIAHLLLGLAGAAATVAVAYQVDLPAARTALNPSVEPGEPVSGLSALYTVRLVQPGWRRTTPGTIGDANADLELVSPDQTSWVVSYVHAARESSLHDTVSGRRAAIQELGRLDGFHEERRFASGTEMIPISIARYQVETQAFLRQTFVTYTASTGDHLVEIIGFVGSKSGSDVIRSLIESVELVPSSPAEEKH